jgi:hypothetical protein
MAALQDTRTADGWPDTAPAAAADRPIIDYSPSVPAPKRTDIVDDDDLPEPAMVESRYRRNSAKLPRIGIDASTASAGIANLRKQMTSDD